MPGQSSSPRCWHRQLRLAAPAAAQAIRLHGIPARRLRRSPQRISPRALAVRFPAPSRRLPLLRDRLQGQEAAVRPAAVVVVAVAAAGKNSGQRELAQSKPTVTVVTAQKFTFTDTCASWRTYRGRLQDMFLFGIECCGCFLGEEIA